MMQESQILKKLAYKPHLQHADILIFTPQISTKGYKSKQALKSLTLSKSLSNKLRMSITEAAFTNYHPFVISKRQVTPQKEDYMQPTLLISKIKKLNLPLSIQYFHPVKLISLMSLENCYQKCISFLPGRIISWSNGDPIFHAMQAFYVFNTFEFM